MKQALFAILIGLQVVDVATTLSFLKLGGKEDNPIMRRIFEFFGDPELGHVVSKAIAIILVIFVYDQIPTWGFALICAMYLWVIYGNVKYIKRLKG